MSGNRMDWEKFTEKLKRNRGNIYNNEKKKTIGEKAEIFGGPICVKYQNPPSFFCETKFFWNCDPQKISKSLETEMSHSPVVNVLQGHSCKTGNVRYGGTSKTQHWNYQTFDNFVLKFFQTYVIQLEINNGSPLFTFCSPIMEDYKILDVPP